MELVSIVMPTYNHADYIGKALDSVIAQSYKNWECIVVNNHSVDNTVEIVESYRDPRIRLFNFSNHGVIAASRNYGIRQAAGELVAFLDSDDIWYSDKLSECLLKIGEGYDLVCHGEKWTSRRSTRDVYYGPGRRATAGMLLFQGNCISTSAVVVSRKYLIRLDGFCEHADMVTAEDYDLWLRLAEAGVRIGFINKLLGEYNIHGDNLSGSVIRNMQAVMQVVKTGYSRIPNKHILYRLLMIRRIAIVYYSGARGLSDTARFSAAWPYYFKAWLHWPFYLRLYAGMLLNLLRYRVND